MADMLVCERCGGPQEWTIYDGVTFVRCTVCRPDQCVMPGFDLPSDSEDPGYAFARAVEGTSKKEGVEPLEGGAANESEQMDVNRSWGPPRAFLDSLWEGDWHGSAIG